MAQRPGDRRDDGRTGDPPDPAHTEQGAGHGGAGVPGADHGVGPPVADGLGAAHQRRVLLAAHALGRVVVHGHDLAGVEEAPRCRPGRRESSPSSSGPTTGSWPDEEDGDARLGRQQGAGHDLARGPVAAHGVDRHQRDRRAGAVTAGSAAGARRSADLGHLQCHVPPGRPGSLDLERPGARRTTRSWGRRRGAAWSGGSGGTATGGGRTGASSRPAVAGSWPSGLPLGDGHRDSSTPVSSDRGGARNHRG